MLHILTIILPVFGLIGLGYAARFAGYVTDRTGEGLSEFVFAIAIPCLIFKTLTGAVLPETQPWGYWFSYFSGAAIIWTIAHLITRRFFGRDRSTAIVSGFTAAQSNTVLVGIPLILEAYGPEGAVPLFLLIAVHLPIMIGAATLLIEGRSAHPGAVLWRVINHPILIAILFSSAFRLSGFHVPALASSIIDPLGATAVPCALFAMGIALKRYGSREEIGLVTVLCGLKLILQPALVFILAFHVFDVPPVWAGVAVLFASAPTGINAYLFAERYKTGMGIASSGIAVSSAFSVISTAFWLIILGIH